MKKKHPNKHFLVRQERIRDLEYVLSVLIRSYKYQDTMENPFEPLGVEIEAREEVSTSNLSENTWLFSGRMSRMEFKKCASKLSQRIPVTPN